MVRAAAMAGMMFALAAGTIPVSSSPGAAAPLKVVLAGTCRPVVRGQKCALELSVANLSHDVAVVRSINSDRTADTGVSFLRDQYGNLSERGGQIVLNSMAQQATPKVFFGKQALLLPGETRTLTVVTRLFGTPRRLTVRAFRIGLPALGKHVFARDDAATAKPLGSREQTFLAVADMRELERLISRDGLNSLVLWNSSALAQDEAEVKISTEVRDPAFGLEAARAKLPSGAATAEVSFSDTFHAWLFGTPGGTWLVREVGAELLGQVDFAVFEKIDEAQTGNVRFQVPEQAFKDTGYRLEPGDGMYTRGTFLSASGERLLGVFRLAKEKGLRATVRCYFFSSWYIALSPVVPKQ